ncbi:MAG: ACT domain-containing protein [Phycisphaerae bacterium]
MKITQLSVFLENKPGRLSEPCQILADAGINILTLSLADTEQFGIMRLIVEDWAKAKNVLTAAGSVVNVTEVVATEVDDRPGGLARLLGTLESAEINIEYMYAFTFRRADKAILIFRFEDPDAAVEVLRAKDINVIDPVELFGNGSN